MPIDLVRDAAIDVLLRVFERGVHLDISLDKTLRRKKISDRGRRFMTQLVYGTVRHRLLCDHVLGGLCHQPLDELPLPIRVILQMGVFQALFCNQVTFPSMVHTSVDLAKRRGHAGTARLVNAVLRKAPQRLEDLRFPSRDKDLGHFLSLRYSMPRWIVDMWTAEHSPALAEELCAASAQPAPVTLRANRLKNTAEELIDLLVKSGYPAAKTTPIPEEITLREGGAPFKSKWFQNGCFMVQDPASMLPAHLLEPEAGDRVLDLCAAPGGKSTHLAELCNDTGFVLSLDLQWGRLKALEDNTARLGLGSVRAVCGDGVHPPLRGGFDRVLVDAPCSGLGTLRRHPDLKWNLRPEALSRLAGTQRALLRSGSELCKNGGLIVYSVCTFTRQETLDVVQAVMGECRLELEDGPEWLNTWKTARGQYQILPSGGALDGFFLTRLRKRS